MDTRLVTTPNLQRFAAQATAYTRAYADSTFSLPSHASLLTGLLPHSHGANHAIVQLGQTDESGRKPLEFSYRPLSDHFLTIPEYLGMAGMQSALVSANYGYLSPAFGLDQGFDYVDSNPRNLLRAESVAGPVLRSQPFAALRSLYARLARKPLNAPEINERVRRWLDVRGDAPFFLMVNFMDVHEPASTSHAALRVPDIAHDFSDAGGNRSLGLQYDLSIRYLDHHLQYLFDELRERDVFDSSLIIITSDHGESLQTQAYPHGRLPFENQIHVPLLIKMPGQRTGAQVDNLVQGIDILPTILSVLGRPVPEDLEGHLAGESTAVVSEVFFSRYPGGPVFSDNVDATRPSSWVVVKGDWKLMLLSDGGKRLFRPVDEPDETRDFAEVYPEVAKEMEEHLRALLPPSAFADYLSPITHDDLDVPTLERLRSLGYVQ